MASTKRFTTILLASTACAALAGCGADDIASPGEGNLINIITPAPTPTPSPTPTPTPTPTPPGGPFAGPTPAGFTDRGVVNGRRVFEMPTRFTQDTTIQNLPGAVYSIAGPVNVGTDIGGDGAATLAGGNRVTLTVQPGVIVIASQGLDYLQVNRGSRLNAIGTATQPIIFTARANLEGTATDSTQGLWGGIILLGRAPISDCNTAVAGGSAGCQNVIEGTTSGLYGGNVANDSSGSLQFIQIRYSGFAISQGNELQGLTTGGAGNATQMNNVQVHNSSDDGVEFFGGQQNARYLAITGADDDALDTDLGYTGFMQFVVAVQRDANNGDSAVEADSNGNEDALPRQNTRLANFTFVQRSMVQGGNVMLIRGGADYTMVNGVVSGTGSCLDIDETGGTTTRAANPALQDAGPPVFRSVVFSCTNAFRADGNEATVATIFGTGTNNNNSAFVSSLASVFVNGANERAVTPFAAATLNPAGSGAPNQFQTTTYIGAVRDAADTAFAGWTCNAGYVNFGTTSGSCTALPAIGS